ncbi:RNA polymerase sigma factor [Microbacterium sp. H83]|uniref:RNA polymerase sigma factor n=1 Tax=Microbacterium sp. H83 TaxID=1827324 RepID=UPI000A47D697|nr:sigma-70 family RNA polymerase sigma factor [Microbacterium sp. H83]
MTPTTPVPDDDVQALDPSDAEVIEAVRAGDIGDFALLWRRHAESARRAARAISPSSDADDLVSEAFASILRVMKAGGGPVDAFRPYLLATLRNTAARWARTSGTVSIDVVAERELAPADDPLERISERSSIAAVFTTLSARHRTLLWYLEVEGMRPREIAPILGMTPNAVSALAVRARDGFRRAWLEAHIRDPSRPEDCRWFCERVVARRERSVRSAEAQRFGEHADGCQGCRLVAAEIDTVSQRLRSILPAALIGGAAAAIYLGDEPSATGLALAGDPWRRGYRAVFAGRASSSDASAGSGSARLPSIPAGVTALALVAASAAMVTGAVFVSGIVRPPTVEARSSDVLSVAAKDAPADGSTGGIESDAAEPPEIGLERPAPDSFPPEAQDPGTAVRDDGRSPDAVPASEQQPVEAVSTLPVPMPVPMPVPVPVPAPPGDALDVLQPDAEEPSAAEAPGTTDALEAAGDPACGDGPAESDGTPPSGSAGRSGEVPHGLAWGWSGGAPSDGPPSPSAPSVPSPCVVPDAAESGGAP